MHHAQGRSFAVVAAVLTGLTLGAPAWAQPPAAGAPPGASTTAARAAEVRAIKAG